jgi:hypothetical protein
MNSQARTLKTLKNFLLRSPLDERHFHPAVLAVTGVLPDAALRFEVMLGTLAIRDGVAEVEASIDADGLRVSAVVDGWKRRTHV